MTRIRSGGRAEIMETLKRYADDSGVGRDETKRCAWAARLGPIGRAGRPDGVRGDRDPGAASRYRAVRVRSRRQTSVAAGPAHRPARRHPAGRSDPRPSRPV